MIASVDQNDVGFATLAAHAPPRPRQILRRRSRRAFSLAGPNRRRRRFAGPRPDAFRGRPRDILQCLAHLNIFLSTTAREPMIPSDRAALISEPPLTASHICCAARAVPAGSRRAAPPARRWSASRPPRGGRRSSLRCTSGVNSGEPSTFHQAVMGPVNCSKKCSMPPWPPPR